MSKRKIIELTTMALGIVSFIFLVGYFLALHDIFHDYASPEVLRSHNIAGTGNLPQWTACPLEWKIVRLGFLPMLIFHILFFANYSSRMKTGRQSITKINE